MKKMIRLICSRNALCVLLIICELGGIIPFFTLVANNSVILWMIAFATGYLTFLFITNQDINPEYKIPWISLVLIVPPFGALLYGLFHDTKLSKKDVCHLEELERRVEIGSGRGLEMLENGNRRAYGMAKALLYHDRAAQVYCHTRAEYYPLGEDMFAQMLVDLSTANHFIFLEYFIVEEGVMWNSILTILKKKAAEGVEVRRLYDDLCSFSCLPPNYDKTLRRLGIQCYRFSKFTPVASIVHNNRDHRKIMVVDGRIGYTGGINLADEYINQKMKFGHWKDGGIRLEGEAVWGLTKLFLMNWDINQKTISEYKKYQPVTAETFTEAGYYIPFGSGPKPLYHAPVGEKVFLNLINQAEKYVFITTPYLIIDYELADALRIAAIRGVEVVIITPHIPDKKVVYLMTRSNYYSLMEVGVRIYEYKDGFIHGKNMTVDDKFAVVGTINMDYRSLVHHYEDAIWIYGSEIIGVIREDFENTLEKSIRMTERNTKMNKGQIILKNLVRLFAPLL